VKDAFLEEMIDRITEEKRLIERRSELLDSMLASLRGLSDQPVAVGGIRTEAFHLDSPPIPLKEASRRAMMELERFTERQLASKVREKWPDLGFNDKSLRKPMKKAVEDGLIRQIQPNIGNKSQAIYEWIGP
jgi:hypothetical protein